MMDRYELDTLWSATLKRSEQSPEEFEKLAEAVFELHQSGDDRFATHVSNRVKNIGKEQGLELHPTAFDIEMARMLVADEIGFPNWESLIAAIGDNEGKPLVFKYAAAAMVRGDFSALESNVGGPDQFHDAIVDWYENGYFDDEPETLTEVFSAACMLGHERTAAYLLDKGVDPLAGTRTGLNGFHYAASSGRLNVVKLLIDRKVPMEVENMYGGTVFGQAMWSAVNEHKPDHASIIEALFKAGTVVDEGYREWWDKQDVPGAATKERVAELLKRHLESDQETATGGK